MKYLPQNIRNTLFVTFQWSPSSRCSVEEKTKSLGQVNNVFFLERGKTLELTGIELKVLLSFTMVPEIYFHYFSTISPYEFDF